MLTLFHVDAMKSVERGILEEYRVVVLTTFLRAMGRLLENIADLLVVAVDVRNGLLDLHHRCHAVLQTRREGC